MTSNDLKNYKSRGFNPEILLDKPGPFELKYSLYAVINHYGS